MNMKTDEITPLTPHVDVMAMARHGAADIAKSLLIYYESAYPDDKRPRMALAVAYDVANGRESERARSVTAGIAQAAYNDANRAAETCGANHLARYWAAADAAEAVLEALQPVVNITAARQIEEDAHKRFQITQEQQG